MPHYRLPINGTPNRMRSPFVSGSEIILAAGETDPLFGNVVLRMPFDGANGSTVFTDITGKSVSRFGSPVISTSQFRFGGASAFFDGSGSYLEIADTADLVLVGVDYAIETWINTASISSAYRTIVDKFNSAGNSGSYQITQTSTYLEFYWSAFSTANPLLASSAGSIAANTWYFIQLIRSGNNFTLGINGSAVSTATNTAAGNDTGQNFHIGSQGSGSNVFSGYIDDLRITKAVSRPLILPTMAFPTS